MFCNTLTNGYSNARFEKCWDNKKQTQPPRNSQERVPPPPTRTSAICQLDVALIM